MTLTTTQVERFMFKIGSTFDCWLWTAARESEGYGQIKINGRLYMAHRVSYELFVGPIPSGLQLDHYCDVRHCVNPSHTKPATGKENTRRAFAHITRCPKGHKYDPKNTYERPSGGRACRTCRNLTSAKIRMRRGTR